MQSIAALMTVLALSASSVNGMASYLKKIPNGDSFAKGLGHTDDGGYTEFGKAFQAASTTWSADFCGQKFPGSDMTNGEAFGDPCCTWKEGAAPDFTVAAFTTTPGEKTTCAASTTATSTTAKGDSKAETPAGSSAYGGTPASETTAPATEATTPAPTTETPAGSSAYGSTPAQESTVATETPAPATTAPTTTAPAPAPETQSPESATQAPSPASTTGAPASDTPKVTPASDSTTGNSTPANCKVKPSGGKTESAPRADKNHSYGF